MEKTLVAAVSVIDDDEKFNVEPGNVPTVEGDIVTLDSEQYISAELMDNKLGVAFLFSICRNCESQAKSTNGDACFSMVMRIRKPDGEVEIVNLYTGSLIEFGMEVVAAQVKSQLPGIADVLGMTEEQLEELTNAVGNSAKGDLALYPVE